ncbi:peptidylprolyl isomerase [Vulcaniibacterium gelatinicum]|uniref:peptidylprolyl isomerase n=1 Tax=Vulcaniibacterium gelatinicum TaxID=2598725 RepID=UPI0011CCDEDF|nr:peptidylprolyl isomerase [Vulcaniibacterium gelatinicum]
MSRAIPIVMDQGALSEAARAGARTHAHDDDPSRPLPGPAPAWVRVGDTTISEAEIAREMQYHRAADPHAARNEAARALVVRELLRLEIERLGLHETVQPEDGETREEACIRVLLEREAPVPQPDEAACRQYFEHNRQRLHHPDRILARHILLAAPPADARARARACEQGEALIAELREHPERFAELAMRHSGCPSRDAGGELGWIERGDTTPEFERQLFMLKPGLAGLTVESRWGHHVVHVDAIERGEPLEFAEAAPKIAAYLETQARQNAIHQYLRLLAERYPVSGLDDFV